MSNSKTWVHSIFDPPPADVDLRDMLIDYYVEAIDGNGVVARSPIQHVYIGDGSGGGPGEDAVTIDPDPAQAGQQAAITYDPTGRPLDGAAQVYLHYGFNGWNPVISPDPTMIWNDSDSVWQIMVGVSSSATQLDMAFNNGADLWDNNGGTDWHFAVTGGEPPDDAWTMDGQLDAAATLVAENNGMVLYAGVIDETLYVATWDAGEGNDHFVFLADSPGGLQPAPWTKAGQVAGWAAFIGNENDSLWAGWFDDVGASDVTAGGGGGYLEGTIDLFGQFGSVPDRVYLAVAPYLTPDGGSLQYDYQVPTSINDDGNVDAGEYVALGTIMPGDCSGDWRVDADDVACFVNVLLGADTDARHVGAADLDDSGGPDGLDVRLFVDVMVDG